MTQSIANSRDAGGKFDFFARCLFYDRDRFADGGAVAVGRVLGKVRAQTLYRARRVTTRSPPPTSDRGCAGMWYVGDARYGVR